MPKIIIREYDNTKAVNGATGNFSVVVPGKVADDKGTTGFDANGVCEVSTEKDFINNIGKVPGCIDGERAVAGSCTVTGTATELEAVTKIITGATNITATGEGSYSGSANPAAGEIYIDPTTDGAEIVVYLGADGTTVKSATSVMCTGLSLAKETVAAEDPSITNWVAPKAAVNVAYNGNQIAYELVKAGYTVLYKKFDSVSELLGQSNTFFDCFKDKSTYDFRYITTGGLFDLTVAAREKEVYTNIINVAKFADSDATANEPGRGDCVALLDVNEKGVSVSNPVNGIIQYVNGIDSADKFSAIFAPQVTYADTADVDYGSNTTFPASVDYLLCAAYSRNRLNFNEWYAVAGYNRGVSEKTIRSTSLQLGEIAINALQPRTRSSAASTTEPKHSVNVVTKIRGNYYLWGNRTAHEIEVQASGEDRGLRASHFLNIRQLCSTLKKDIWNACKSLTFDPNSDVLWGTFCNKIKATLEKMKADQGIADYKIVKVKSNVKAKLTAKVRIVPIEAVEDFDISIYLEDSLTGVDVKSSEEE